MFYHDLLREPSEHNIAWAWVKALVPSDHSTPFSIGIAIFNTTLVYIGVLAVGWYIISGIVHSATTGKVLGDKYHQIWAPLRVIAGFGLLVPISMDFASGHYFLRDVVARASINLADSIAVAVVEYGTKAPMVPPTENGKKLVVDIFEAEICAAISNRLWKDLGSGPMPLRPAAMGEREKGFAVWRYGDWCGQISMEMLEKHETLNVERQKEVGKIMLAARRIIRGKDGNNRDGYLSTYFLQKTGHAINDITDVLTALKYGKLPPLLETVRGLAKNYDAAITVAVAKAIEADAEANAINKKIAAKVRQEGFIGLGMVWMHLNVQSQQIMTMTDIKHKRNAYMSSAGVGDKDLFENALKAFRLSLFAEESEIEISANDYAYGADQDSNLYTRLTAPTQRAIQEWMMKKHGKEGDSTVQQIIKSDPIGDQIWSGQWFMTLAVGIVVTGFGLVALAFTTPADALGMDGAALWGMIWSFFPITGLYMVGALRAYVLPVLPFICFYMFASTWLVGFLECIIAIGAWALSFFKMDGDEMMAQSSRLGSMIIFQVFLMLPLGVLAYAGCFVLMPLIVGGIDVLWSRAYFAQTGGYPMGLGGIVICYALITLLTMYLSMHILSQIFGIPHRINVWLGGQGYDFGGNGMFIAAATTMAATVGRGMPGLPNIPMPKGKKDEGGEEENGAGKLPGNGESVVPEKRNTTTE